MHWDSSFLQCRSWFDHGRLMRYRRRRTEFAPAPICPPPSARLARASWSARGFGPPTSPVFCNVLRPVTSLGFGIGAKCDFTTVCNIAVTSHYHTWASLTSFGRISRWKASWARRLCVTAAVGSLIQLEGFVGAKCCLCVCEFLLHHVVRVALHFFLLLVAVPQERANARREVPVYRNERRHVYPMVV